MPLERILKMSLNWNIEKCKNWKELNVKPQWPVTDSLIWATMAVGISTITKTNAEEFHRRLHLYEAQEGSYLLEGGKPSPITLEDVERRIGLSTNAGSLSKTEFKKKLERLANR
jgi:hypothetical protein